MYALVLATAADECVSLGCISILELSQLGHPGSHDLIHLGHGEAFLCAERVHNCVILLVMVVGLLPLTIRGGHGFGSGGKGARLFQIKSSITVAVGFGKHFSVLAHNLSHELWFFIHALELCLSGSLLLWRGRLLPLSKYGGDSGIDQVKSRLWDCCRCSFCHPRFVFKLNLINLTLRFQTFNSTLIRKIYKS